MRLLPDVATKTGWRSNPRLIHDPTIKIHLIVLLSVTFGSFAYLLGSRSQNSDRRSEAHSENPRSSRARRNLPPGKDALRDRKRTSFKIVFPKDAERLSPDQRLEMVATAVRLSDINQQAQILCGVLAAMSRDELPAAVKELLNARSHGGDISHAVWSSLWERVGEIAPEIVVGADAAAAIALSKDDWPSFMNGWHKSDPAEAMTWAESGNHEEWMAPAVARAITHSADGNLKQMESAMVKLSPNTATTRECLQDYYDLALVSGGKTGPAELYENLALELREAAWPVTLGRLTYTAPREAAAWLEVHANDAGVEYPQTQRLAVRLANEDPVWTMEWLSRVEVDHRKNGDIQGPPLSWIVENIWRRKDPAAADAWQAEQRAKFEAAAKPSSPSR